MRCTSVWLRSSRRRGRETGTGTVKGTGSNTEECHMSLSTNYLGLKLAHPFMPGASPLVDDLDMVRRLEDAGASAIVMHSLFEEQISREQYATIYHMEMFANAFAEVQSYFPSPREFALGPEQYLEQVRRIKAAVAVPVIAPLNGTTG